MGFDAVVKAVVDGAQVQVVGLDDAEVTFDADLLRSTANFCEGRVGPESIYGVLHRECFSLFPDGMFADLFTDVGRRSVPPMIVAVVMVLQRIEGCRIGRRWTGSRSTPGGSTPRAVWISTIRGSCTPCWWTCGPGWPARIGRTGSSRSRWRQRRRRGLVGRKRVLDSTPLYDAVATMDTVTLVRSAIRGLLKVADAELAAELRAVVCRDDDYASAGKPVCDYDDAAAREALVDALARDATALLAALHGRELAAEVNQAAQLLATVVGQDLDRDTDGVFRIARRVAADRVISTVDPEARHGHKTSARGFDGYKGHVAIDPDAEIVTATEVSAANAGDAEPAPDLLADDLPDDLSEDTNADAGAGDGGDDDPNPGTGGGADAPEGADRGEDRRRSTAMRPTARGSCWPGWKPRARRSSRRCSRRPRRVGGSPRTASPSTWTRARSPARAR